MESPKPSLSDQLKSLGVKLGARDLAPPLPRRERYPIEAVFPGQVTATPYGEVFVAEKWYGPEYRHGLVTLRPDESLHLIAEWAGDLRVATTDLESFAFLDTETTGLAGGAGTYAFMIGVGRFEGERFRLAQFFMREPPEEPAQLAALSQFLAPCQVLVTFNGKSFDGPLISNRYITHGERFPLAEAAHLDLLHLARRLWRDRLPSRALGELERHILTAERTEEDAPGWLIPTLYFDYLRSGDARPLRGIFYHNAMDVLAMAALLNHISYMLADPFAGRIEYALDLVAVGRLFEDLGRLESAARLFEQGLARNDLPEEHYWQTQERLAVLQRRRGNLAAAVEVWRQAAEGRRVYAHVELAKFYEHKQRDFEEAARWTRAALNIINMPTCPQMKRRRWLPELRHRLARLERKLNR